jgi:hypothetical protein
MCWALIGVPKTSRDMKKDCDKPGCPTDHRRQVLTLGDEMIEQERRRLPPLALFGHGAMSDSSPLSGEERKSNFGAARSVDDPTATLAAFRHSTVKSQLRPKPNSRERSMGVLSSTPFQIYLRNVGCRNEGLNRCI